MYIPVNLPGFEGQRIAVTTASFFSGPQLTVNGQPAPRGDKRNEYRLRRNDGQFVTATLRPSFPDTVPVLVVGNQTHRLAEPLAWYQWVWAAAPIVLLFLGGAIGGLIGGLATAINVNLFRSELPMPARFGLTFLVSALGFLLYVVAAGSLMVATQR